MVQTSEENVRFGQTAAKTADQPLLEKKKKRPDQLLLGCLRTFRYKMKVIIYGEKNTRKVYKMKYRDTE